MYLIFVDEWLCAVHFEAFVGNHGLFISYMLTEFLAFLCCRLHYKAGSKPIELHGTTHEVICLDCGDMSDRYLFQNRVKKLNPEVNIIFSKMVLFDAALCRITFIFSLCLTCIKSRAT